MTNGVRTLLLIVGILLSIADASAELVVVANPKSGVDKLSRDEVVNIFLGRFRQLPSGRSALPADLPTTQPERAVFYRLLVNKELSEINSYWARLIFSGRTVPPRQATSTDDLLVWIATTPGSLGYVERARADARVKIVFEFTP
jgi:ABC-type phosphate transport system substrate-binding protein